MNQLFLEMSSALAKVVWQGHGKDRQVTGFPDPIPDHWPLAPKLRAMMSIDAEHVKAVIASVNHLLDERLQPTDFFLRTTDPQYDGKADVLLTAARGAFWYVKPRLFGSFHNEFVNGLLRIAALYHDIGITISRERHVSRGVHVMRDVSGEDRVSVESLFNDAKEKRDFWALLRHHDVYGVLCTGEASLTAFADMVGWAYPENDNVPLDRTVLAYLSYLVMLNMADSDARLTKYLGGITTVEGCRYLTDWCKLKDYLLPEGGHPRNVKREDFKNWLAEAASHPEAAIERVTRLVATCYRKEMALPPPEADIQVFVEEELEALFGPRLERFSYCLARICKLDYGLSFFYLLGRHALLDEVLLVRTDGSSREAFPSKVQPAATINLDARSRSLRKMINRTCLVLQRIVEDYGHLVEAGERSAPLLGLDMTGLMRPQETGWAICLSLADSPSRALWWIANEIGAWLYGE